MRNLFLIVALVFLSSTCWADDGQQVLGIDKVCSDQYLNANNKQLCNAELLLKATYVDKKVTLHVVNLNSYAMLNALHLTVLKFRSDRSVCDLYRDESYLSCINAALDKASEDVDVKNPSLNTYEVKNLNASEIIKTAKANFAKILNVKLNELNTCRLAYVNKLDDNVSSVADIASAVQSKCKYLAYEFYDYHLLSDSSVAFDIFAEDPIDFVSMRMLVNSAVEKNFGQQATIALVLEQRANRKETATKRKKLKSEKKLSI